MTTVSHSGLAQVSGALALSVLISGALFFWLWREYTLYAVVAAALLFSGAAYFLPSRKRIAHAMSVGFCIGVFTGCLIGAMVPHV